MAYRKDLNEIKYGALILMLVLSFPNLSQAIELKGVLESNRLTTSPDHKPSNVEVIDSSRCGPHTQELILIYPDVTANAAKSIADDISVAHPAFNPCDTSAIHSPDGTLRLSFSYVVPKNKKLQIQVTNPSNYMVIDHWIGLKKEKSPVKFSRDVASASNPRGPIRIDNLNDLAKIKDIQLRSFSNLDSSYRDPKVEQDIGLDKSMLKFRSLDIPVLHFNLKPTDVNFEPLEFPFKEFQLSHVKMSSILKKSLDAIIEMAKRQDWIRAMSANDILLKSKLAKEYNDLGFFTSALNGYLKISAALADPETKENRLFSIGINIWRETLLKQAIAKEGTDPFLDFMYLESLRYLYNQKDFYTGLAMIDEVRSIPWSSTVLERSQYLEGVALLSLGMFQKAKTSFTKYIQDRKNLNIKDVSDRRLLPSAAFRLADVDFAREDYATALQNYEKAMSYLPGSRKVNLEGYIYPESLVAFPQVLMRMAEAHARMGDYAKALKRLRALMAFDVSGTNHGLAMFRIAELLKYLNSDPKKVLSIFRECAYRYDGYLAGKLCDIHSVSMDPQYQQRNYWPRLETTFLKFEKHDETQGPIEMGLLDRKMYSSLVKAKFYLDRDKPLIALSALDSTRSLESSAYLKDWNFEFSASAFLGVLRESIHEGDYKAVIESYEKRRKNLFLYLDRPPVLLAVAKAYVEQGLWSEASEAYARATQLQSLLVKAKPRPYDYTNDEWAYTKAQISVGLYDEGKIERSEVEATLQNLSDSDMPGLMLLVGFAQKSSNLGLEITAWKKLDEKFSLDWAQVKSYSSALLKFNRPKLMRDLLEKYVGRWFYDKDKSRDMANADARPDSILLMRLAESRIENGAIESGLRVFEYLTKLDAKDLDPSTPKELFFYSMGKALVSKKDYILAQKSFQAATDLAPASVWGRLAAAEMKMNSAKALQAQAR